MASHYPIDHSETPIRLFKSDFMEFFTHISPIAVIVLWVPVAVGFMLLEIFARRGLGWVYMPIAFLVGLFLWTFRGVYVAPLPFSLPGEERTGSENFLFISWNSPSSTAVQNTFGDAACGEYSTGAGDVWNYVQHFCAATRFDALALAGDVWFHRRLFILRPDPLCDASLCDAQRDLEGAETLSYATPL